MAQRLRARSTALKPGSRASVAVRSAWSHSTGHCPAPMLASSPAAHRQDVDDDASCMLAFAAGDASAFDRVYARHKGPVYRYLLRHCASHAPTADELFQDVWMNVVRASATYVPTARFTTWLYRIAHNPGGMRPPNLSSPLARPEDSAAPLPAAPAAAAAQSAAPGVSAAGVAGPSDTAPRRARSTGPGARASSGATSAQPAAASHPRPPAATPSSSNALIDAFPAEASGIQERATEPALTVPAPAPGLAVEASPSPPARARAVQAPPSPPAAAATARARPESALGARTEPRVAAAPPMFEDWIARIRLLLREGRIADAQRELARLREAYPARLDDIPAELRALMPAKLR